MPISHSPEIRDGKTGPYASSIMMGIEIATDDGMFNHDEPYFVYLAAESVARNTCGWRDWPAHGSMEEIELIARRAQAAANL